MFNEIIKKIEENKKLKESGKTTSILLPFKRFSKIFSGFQKSSQILITANSGIGKTKLAKFLTVTHVYNFAKQHPEIDYKLFYFALEESTEFFWLGMISTMLYEKHNLSVSPNQLKSLGEYILSDDALNKIKDCQEIIEDMQKHIEVIDYLFNPYGCYKYIADWFANPEIGKEEFDTSHAEKISKKYIYKNPNLWVFVVTDNLNLLTPEQEDKGSLHSAMGRYSKQFCLKGFTKKYQCVTINIQQQASDTEKQEYYQGQSIEQKLEPSLNGLGDNKTTQRECDLVLGLFAPERYNISTHRKYNIKLLKNHYRSLMVLKDRNDGLINTYVPLYFNGATNFFSELEPVEEIDYNKYISK
jgi:replicative DNA helicase